MMQENPPIDVAKNNSFRLFRNDSFGKVRTVIIGDEPYFVGKDVAEALGYSNQTKAVITHVDERDRLLQKFHDGGQVRSMTVINESGLYALVLSSHKEDAKDFKYWITSEVLPEIRRSGTYTVKRRYPYNNYGPGKQYSNYPARYGNNTETILNAVAETLSKIRINIDVVLIKLIVNQCSNQIVDACDSMNVTSEMKVDIIFWFNDSFSSSGSSSFDTEDWA